jgi:hypothetical protein
MPWSTTKVYKHPFAAIIPNSPHTPCTNTTSYALVDQMTYTGNIVSGRLSERVRVKIVISSLNFFSTFRVQYIDLERNSVFLSFKVDHPSQHELVFPMFIVLVNISLQDQMIGVIT